MTLPNFLVIGAAKSGTTSLWKYLGQHPDVYMSPLKEPGYFAYDEFVNRRAALNRPLPIGTLADYEALFALADGALAVGEATPYLSVTRAAERIGRELPDARLIAILRHPAERAYSQFLQARRSGVEPIADFGAAIDAQAVSGRPFTYVGSGLYHHHLSMYETFRRDDRLLVLLFDDLVRDAAAVCRRAFAFLGVDPDFTPDTSTRYNAPVSNDPRLDRVASKAGGMVGRAIPEAARRRATRWLQERRGGHRIPPAVRARLLDAYRDDTLALQRRLDRDLSAWLR